MPSQMMGLHQSSSLEDVVMHELIHELMSPDIRGMEKQQHFPHYRLADTDMYVDISLITTITR